MWENLITGIEALHIKCDAEARTNSLKCNVVEQQNYTDWLKDQIWSQRFNLKKKERSRNCFHCWIHLEFTGTSYCIFRLLSWLCFKNKTRDIWDFLKDSLVLVLPEREELWCADKLTMKIYLQLQQNLWEKKRKKTHLLPSGTVWMYL